MTCQSCDHRAEHEIRMMEPCCVVCPACRATQAVVKNPESSFYLRSFPVVDIDTDEDTVFVQSWGLILAFGLSEVWLA